ncbi:MAG: PilT/PilU family type 4a pilus ATPase [Bdellovibrionales bacterium]|nr:PilT/PilU family type 4a pilus ATPase [Bdellovibrionales bacterium]
MITLVQLLKLAKDQNASDLHIVAGSPPCLRIEGKIIRVKTEPLSPQKTRELCFSILNESQKSRFENSKELDFSFDVKDLSRFRGNYFFQKNCVSGVFRRIPTAIPHYGELNLPPAVPKLTNLPNGLILVTGPTGSGKSTTIASLVQKINEERQGHIVTLEDPIEFVHPHNNCIVNQREIGTDCVEYSEGLKHLLRQDPDYCVIGEMRDLETIETALKLAETGHLVFATLHTNSAVQTINRIVSIFAPEQQERIRVLLSFTLQAVMSQRLVTMTNGKRTLVAEFLLLNQGIRNLIREGKLHQVQNLMEVGQEKSGMNTLNQALAELVKSKKIAEKEAYLETGNPDELFKLLQRG